MVRGFVSEIDLLERIRLNIRSRRAASAWSVGAAAKRAGMHARHWQKLEACEVNATLRTLSRIALVFGVDAAELVAAPSPPTPPALASREAAADAPPTKGPGAAKKAKKGGKAAGAKAKPKAAKRPAKPKGQPPAGEPAPEAPARAQAPRKPPKA